MTNQLNRSGKEGFKRDYRGRGKWNEENSESNDEKRSFLLYFFLRKKFKNPPAFFTIKPKTSTIKTAK